MYRETLKGKAYAFILLSLLWTLFSAFGMFDWLDMHRRLSLDPDGLPDLIVWGLHVLFISLALHFARSERPRPTLCISEDSWLHLAGHACWWVLFANVPLFALWHGSLAAQIAAHAILVLLSMGGLALLRRAEATEAETEQ